MLTQEQMAKMDGITGLTNAGMASNRIAQLREIRNAKKQEIADQPKGFEKVIGKIADFTGGKELGQGLATSIMLPGAQKELDQQLATKTDIQTQIIKKMHENRTTGADNTRLEAALKDITQQIADLGKGAEKALNPYELTGKEVLGDALQMGTTILGSGTYGKGMVAGNKAIGLKNVVTNTGLTKAAPSVIKGVTEATTIGKGIVQGAKSGAISGAAFGTSGGVSSALQDNKSLTDVAISGIGGGILGAGTGAILGGTIGGITGGIKGRALRQAQQKETFGLDFVSEKQTPAVIEKAFKEGRTTPQSFFKGETVLPGKREKKLYDAVSDYIDPKGTPQQNIDVLDGTIEKLNNGLKAYVNQNKVKFNTTQLKNQLNAGKKELDVVFASESTAEKTYDAIVKKFMQTIKNKDTAGLMQARQDFDKIPAIKKLLDSSAMGENVKKQVVLTARDQANKYVAKLLPKGNAYRDVLLKESNMLEVIGRVAEKNTKNFGESRLLELTRKYPFLKLVTASAVGAGLVGSVGVGGAILSSTD